VAGARLTLQERAQIEVLFGQGLSFPQIAAVINRDRTTVWREVSRNHSYKGNYLKGEGAWHPRGRGGGHGARDGTGAGLGGAYRWKYSHRLAHHKANARARRRRPLKLRRISGRTWPPLAQLVRETLAMRWSPVQIARWLRSQFPDQPELWVSHETIYQAIYYQARGGMRDELSRQIRLRTGRATRRPQSRLAAAARSAKPWVGDLHISTRPAEVADRAVPGHWESQCLCQAAVAGAGGSGSW
jgi:IS30 family transposase